MDYSERSGEFTSNDRSMAEMNRALYLERLLSGKNRPDTVKIISGMRRNGKTVLFTDKFITDFLDGIRRLNPIDWLLGTGS